MINPNDLIAFNASELVIDGYFYVKNDEGKFHCAMITQWEINKAKLNGTVGKMKSDLEWMSHNGRLFRRISKPWQHF